MTSKTISQVLAANLTTALSVAGPPDEYGNPRRLRTTQVQRKTGVARSTLRALQNCRDGDSNPDLRTLCRIADELDIPVAFLLMEPQQWLALVTATVSMPTMLEAAKKVDEEKGIHGPASSVNVLREAKVYPLVPPVVEHGARDQARLNELERQNERRRRCATITAALLQAGARTHESRIELTAFAASLANSGAALDGNAQKPNRNL